MQSREKLLSLSVRFSCHTTKYNILYAACCTSHILDLQDGINEGAALEEANNDDKIPQNFDAISTRMKVKCEFPNLVPPTQ